MYAGYCTHYYGRLGVASFLIENEGIAPGDELLIVGASTGALAAKPDELRVDGLPAAFASRGSEPSFKVERKARMGDKLYKLVGA